jgi:DNA-binding LacI/PurR family transcriptional regulator
MPSLLRRIAAAAGVSVGAVSQILNDKGDRFLPSTRERVWQQALALGWRRARPAVHGGSHRARLIGLILDPTANSHAPRPLLDGLIHRAAEHGMAVVIHEIRPGETLTGIERYLGVDALAVNLHHRFDPDLLRQRSGLTVPCCWINAGLPDGCVDVDDRACGAMAVAYLASRGHRTIDYYDGMADRFRQGQHRSLDERVRGWRAALASAGLRGTHIRPSASTDGADHLRAIKARILRPARTAVVCGSGSVAVQIWTSAMACGAPAPCMAAIMDERMGFSGPNLAPVLVPWKRLGGTVVDRLVARLAGGAGIASESIAPADLP